MFILMVMRNVYIRSLARHFSFYYYYFAKFPFFYNITGHRILWQKKEKLSFPPQNRGETHTTRTIPQKSEAIIIFYIINYHLVCQIVIIHPNQTSILTEWSKVVAFVRTWELLFSYAVFDDNFRIKEKLICFEYFNFLVG